MSLYRNAFWLLFLSINCGLLVGICESEAVNGGNKNATASAMKRLKEMMDRQDNFDKIIREKVDPNTVIDEEEKGGVKVSVIAVNQPIQAVIDEDAKVIVIPIDQPLTVVDVTEHSFNSSQGINSTAEMQEQEKEDESVFSLGAFRSVAPRVLKLVALDPPAVMCFNWKKVEQLWNVLF